MNNVIELRVEVRDILQELDYLLFLPPQMLNVNPNEMDASELHTWLFEIYIICGDYEAYKTLNKQIRDSHNYIHSVLRNESIELRALVFT